MPLLNADIDFQRLKEIHQAVDVPLVFHGCTGLKNEDYHKAIALGVKKFNVGTRLMIEFQKEGLPAVQQSSIDVTYENEIVGQYFADIVVDEKVIVEIKARKCLVPEDTAQLLNYLKATDKEVGLLLNFGPKPEVSRKVFDNSKK